MFFQGRADKIIMKTANLREGQKSFASLETAVKGDVPFEYEKSMSSLAVNGLWRGLHPDTRENKDTVAYMLNNPQKNEVIGNWGRTRGNFYDAGRRLSEFSQLALGFKDHFSVRGFLTERRIADGVVWSSYDWRKNDPRERLWKNTLDLGKYPSVCKDFLLSGFAWRRNFHDETDLFTLVSKPVDIDGVSMLVEQAEIFRGDDYKDRIYYTRAHIAEPRYATDTRRGVWSKHLLVGAGSTTSGVMADVEVTTWGDGNPASIINTLYGFSEIACAVCNMNDDKLMPDIHSCNPNEL